MGFVRGNWAEALEDDIRVWFDEEYNSESELQIGRSMFNVGTSDRDEEKYQESNFAVDWSNFDTNGQIVYTSAKQGHGKTIDFTQYTAGVQIERDLVDDMKFNIIESAVRQEAIGALRKQEEDMASVFNLGFTNSILAPDGLSLFNGAHTSLQSGVATQNNSGTSALTEANVRATRLLMKKFKTPGGKKMSVVPNTLLVPIDLEDTAEVITQTLNKVDSTNNDINASRGKYRVIVWDYLDDTNNWFMIDSRLMNLFLIFIDRISIESFSLKEFDTLVAKFAGYMRYGFGPVDWRWIFGQNVA